jgi:hypothetical protein
MPRLQIDTALGIALAFIATGVLVVAERSVDLAIVRLLLGFLLGPIALAVIYVRLRNPSVSPVFLIIYAVLIFVLIVFAGAASGILPFDPP